MRSRMERFVPRSRSTILRFFDDLMGILRVAKCRRHFTTTTTTYSLSAELLLTSHEENENICVCFILKRERFVTSFQLLKNSKHTTWICFISPRKEMGEAKGHGWAQSTWKHRCSPAAIAPEHLYSVWCTQHSRRDISQLLPTWASKWRIIPLGKWTRVFLFHSILYR